jgi:inhibitor of cysteine peptidase
MEDMNMKKLVFLGLVAVMLLPLLVTGCVTRASASLTAEFTLDDFVAQNNIVTNINLNAQDTLTVRLGSNPTTGYSWEDALITNTAIIEQTSHEYLAPTATAIVGAPGTDVWVFTGKSSGTTTITFSYDRSWETVPAVYTLTINITVN